MLKKFHVNENDEARECVAKYKCRFGGDSIHYPTLYDAKLGAERKLMRETAVDAQVTTVPVTKLSEGIIRANGFTLTPGKYFMGDPYITIALRDQEGWNNIVESIDEQYGWENDVLNPEDEKQVAVGAMYGDNPVMALKGWNGEGLYWSLGPTHRIPSDTGLVGVVSMDTVINDIILDPDLIQNRDFGMGFQFNVDEDTEMYRDENGVIVVENKLVIVSNDFISNKIEEMNSADGNNPNTITKETYEMAVEQAKMWNEKNGISHLK